MAIESQSRVGNGYSSNNKPSEPDTFSELQKLYTEGKTSQGQELTKPEANDIINNLGVNFGQYRNAIANAIKGMTRIEAYSYLFNLISSMDKHDGGKDNDGDFRLEGQKSITSVFKDMGLGNNKAAIRTSLKEIGKKVYKDDDGVDATDQELIITFKNIQNGNPLPLYNQAWVGMLQLQDAFGNNADANNNNVSDDLETFNATYGTQFTEQEYQNHLEMLENNTQSPEDITKTTTLFGTSIKITESAFNTLLINGIDTLQEVYGVLDYNNDGEIHALDLLKIAQLDTKDGNNTVITQSEILAAIEIWQQKT